MSKCDTKIFSASEYDIEILEKNVCDGFQNIKTELYEVRVTKKKPQSKLEWRDITPLSGYSLLASHGTANQLSLGYTLRWQRDYRLVQFKLTHEGQNVYIQNGDIILSKNTSASYFSPSIFAEESTNNILLSYEDCLNKWSVPIVIPVVFYAKLDEYVAELNKKLDEGVHI